MKIYNKLVSDDAINAIINSVKEKKKFLTFDDRLIKEFLIKHFEQNVPYIDKVNNLNSKSIKLIAKLVRSKYHGSYEIFMTEKIKERNKILECLPSDYIKTKKHHEEKIIELLKSHLSTKERLPYYEKIYTELFSKFPVPKSILDISSGHNPLSIFMMDFLDDKNARSKLRYDVTELCSKDSIFAKNILKHFNIKSNNYIIDLVSNYDLLEKIPPVDVCFLFKVLDVVETFSKHITYKILNAIQAKYIVCSFPTKNISNINMRLQTRPWLERMCRNLNYEFTLFRVENEIFYIINKGGSCD